MKLLPILVLPLAAAQSITLNPAEMEAAKQRVFGSADLRQKEETTLPEQRWLQAMAAAGTDLQAVRLLALLQELNPQAPLAAKPEAYAEVLALHRRASSGNPAACAELAQSLRSGVLPGGLFILRSEALAARLEQLGKTFL